MRHLIGVRSGPICRNRLVENSNRANRRDTLDALTSLRFFAALLVFTWHCVPVRQFSGTFSLGYIGVGFFFICRASS